MKILCKLFGHYYKYAGEYKYRNDDPACIGLIHHHQMKSHGFDKMCWRCGAGALSLDFSNQHATKENGPSVCAEQPVVNEI